MGPLLSKNGSSHKGSLGDQLLSLKPYRHQLLLSQGGPAVVDKEFQNGRSVS